MEKLFAIRYERVFLPLEKKIVEVKALIWGERKSAILSKIEGILREHYGRVGFLSTPEIKVLEEGSKEFENSAIYKLFVAAYQRPSGREEVIKCEIRPEFFKGR